MSDFDSFDFVYKKYSAAITEPLKKAEKAFWLDYKDSGKHLREVFDAICVSIISDSRGSAVSNENVPLSDLNNNIINIEKAGLFPDMRAFQSVNYITRDGNHKRAKWHFIWRLFGNICVHGRYNGSHYPKICFQNLITVFDIVYHFFLNDAKERGYINDISSYEFTPSLTVQYIGENRITDITDLPDQLCEHEVITETRTEANTLENCGIIRIFEKDHLRKNINQLDAQTREHETYIGIIKTLGITTCCSNTEILSAMSSSYSDHYVIKYVFGKKPHYLTNELLEPADNNRRLKLCLALAEHLKAYHEADVIHRNLNYTSVVVCEGKDTNWIPAILKLEYAKIRAEYTVYGRIRQRQGVSDSITKYTDPALADGLQPSKEKWKQADVYSLGVLFGDILTADVSHCVKAGISELKKAGFCNEICRLVSDMSSTVPAERPKIETIVEILRR